MLEEIIEVGAGEGRLTELSTGELREHFALWKEVVARYDPRTLGVPCTPGRSAVDCFEHSLAHAPEQRVCGGLGASMKTLTVPILCKEAAAFAKAESRHSEPSIYGVTDGKAVGTYFEHKFQQYLRQRYTYIEGSSAKGIDFPELKVDMKVTSIKQPQSSCPFKAARQKIFGLGYSLLVFVYDKSDDEDTRTGRLNILHIIFIEEHRTADFQTTRGIRQIMENEGNADDLIAFMADRNLPVDDIQANEIAQDILKQLPDEGYLTISNALQWRLQYGRVIDKAGSVEGIRRLR